MTRLTQNRWFRRVALGTVAAIGLGAALIPTAPAQARVFVGIGFPGYYAAPAPYYGYPYAYNSYPYSYGYPYAYPTSGIYFGFGGGGWHHHHRHWR
jgi:hypothetical protein